MKQTPVHEQHNPDLLYELPADCRCVVEVGCGSGALAREYRKLNPACRWIGIEVVPDYAELARRHCSEVRVADIETASAELLAGWKGVDCWVFGDSLEHLRAPRRLLTRVRQEISPSATAVACIPNAQHCNVQARLAYGVSRDEDEGLLDRTHLRWFTRSTLIEMFAAAGYRISRGWPRIFPEPQREGVLPALREWARVCGGDPDQAVNDALPVQFVLIAQPV